MRVAARYIGDPRQLLMRRPYFLPEMYMALGKPWAQQLGIRTILDIGASVGNFAFTVRPLFPQAIIYSFEPLPDSFAELRKNLGNTPDCQTFNFALGDTDADLVIHESQHAPSSSFLPMGVLHKQAIPSTAPVVDEVPAKVLRLDGIRDRLNLSLPLLTKIDVQGYELHVLRGGEQTLRQAKALIIETSFQPLYEGGPLFADVFNVVTDWGFTYMGAVDSLENPVSGALLQEDSLFVQL